MAYKLDGVDKDWVYLPYDKNSAFYNQLKKGTYSFWLKWKYGQGKWTEGKVVLVIVQAPAFYETWLAYMVYLVLIVLAVYLSFHTYAQRIKIKNEVKLKEELARTKLNYFTNISHELLTPLTVISCITDHLEQKVPAIRQQSVILKSNADKLKRLIQQILDFRKMDVGKMNLNVSEGNISEFIQNICKTNFLPLAQKKGIILEIDVEPLEIKGYLDFDKLDKIIYNLLSNAIKYTPEYKCIKVNVYLINKEGNKVYVYFEGVYNNSEVFINGKWIGKRPNGYVSFMYDLTPYLKWDEPNVLAVRVDNAEQPNSRWYSGCGIYRNVWLSKTGPIHVGGWGTYVTTSSVDEKQAVLNLATTLVNESDTNENVTVCFSLQDAEGREVAETRSSGEAEAGKEVVFTQQLTVKQPQLWDIDTPYLYTLVTKVMRNEECMDRYTTPVGIRTFSLDARKGFTLNGRQTKINGVCMHHDLGCLGAAVNTRAIERHLEILKEMG